ncbi:MAG: GNAT family N-acetyltransferase [Promethearchaeota archaeon]|jgi:ribosomal-protein-alanine N-acetyltransferase
MKVKNVNFQDLDEIMDLEKKVFKENAFSENLMGNLISKKNLFLKLEGKKKENNLIGFIIVIKDREDQVNIINFLVNPEFQNKGYGTLLLKKTLEIIRELEDIKRVVLNVQVSNSRAIKLYEKFNFRKNPRKIENYYRSGESAFLMGLNLNSL